MTSVIDVEAIKALNKEVRELQLEKGALLDWKRETLALYQATVDAVVAPGNTTAPFVEAYLAFEKHLKESM